MLANEEPPEHSVEYEKPTRIIQLDLLCLERRDGAVNDFYERCGDGLVFFEYSTPTDLSDISAVRISISPHIQKVDVLKSLERAKLFILKYNNDEYAALTKRLTEENERGELK